MNRPTGATHYITCTIQSSQVDTTLSDWMTLIVVCDMDLNINTNAQSFVAGLESDLSDLEITDSNDNPIPWKRADSSTFSQTIGSEKLWIYVNLSVISQVTDTEVKLYRGCTSPTGEDDGTNVVRSDMSVFWDMDGDGTDTITDLVAGYTATPSSSIAGADGVVGNSRFWPGEGPYFSTNGSFTLPVGGEITLMARFKSSGGGWYRDWIIGGRAGTPIIGLRLSPDAVEYIRANNGSGVISALDTDVDIRDEDWHDVVFTYDGSILHWYIDGEFSNSVSGTLTQGINVGMNIGMVGGELFGPGYIDEIMVSDTVWSSDEISTYYTMVYTPSAWSISSEEDLTLRAKYNMDINIENIYSIAWGQDKSSTFIDNPFNGFSTLSDTEIVYDDDPNYGDIILLKND